MTVVHPEFVYSQSDLAYDALLKELRALGLDNKPDALLATAEGLQQAAQRMVRDANEIQAAKETDDV